MSTHDQQRLEIPGTATFGSGEGGLPTVEITSSLARGRIYLQGAHVAEWTPAGELPVLFMSKGSYFAPGKPIRGGVPVCFPWFAARAGRPESPAHGFVRYGQWKVDAIEQKADGTVQLTFSTQDDDSTRAHWPHAFVLRHIVRLGRELEMTLEVENPGDAPFTFEEALHTYFAVSAIQNAEVTGLEGAEYLDKVGGLARKQQPNEPIRFTSETDRVFPSTQTTCVLRDSGSHREIVIEKSGSDTTVVWNPWIAKAAAMPDFGDDEWPGMACIETANAGENAVTLAPGAKHRMTARISLRAS